MKFQLIYGGNSHQISLIYCTTFYFRRILSGTVVNDVIRHFFMDLNPCPVDPLPGSHLRADCILITRLMDLLRQAHGHPRGCFPKGIQKHKINKIVPFQSLSSLKHREVPPLPSVPCPTTKIAHYSSSTSQG